MPRPILLRLLALFVALSFVGIIKSTPPGAPILNLAHPGVQAVAAVQKEVTASWMARPEVLGTAIGIGDDGVPVLVVYIDQDAAKAAEVVRALPEQVRNVPVNVRFTDKFVAMRRHRHHGSGGGGVPFSHSSPQTPPVQLGTSGSWIHDGNGRACCSGTLGGLVQIGGQQYILSNWHVFEDDLVAGGNNAVVTNGDAVVQPGLIDANCTASQTQVVAMIEKHGSLPGSNVDCAVAQVVPGAVRSDGAILEIGTVSSQTTGAFLNQLVKKSGRTSGVTHSVVIGLNATISVEYDQECTGHNMAFTKTFTGQIMVGSHQNGFLRGGDSGSLLVEDVQATPRPIGLLFAGSSSDAIANPINEVLSFLGASIVGN